MMDHKTWSWKRKSSEKIIAASNEQKASPRGNKEQTLLSDKEELQNELATLKEKLSFVLLECNRKDDFAKHQTEVAKEAVAGQEKAEAEARSLKQEADKAIKQRLAIEDRLVSMDASLKECMQQLRFVREEQEKRIYDAIMKTSREYEEMIIVLEERLAETSKRVTMLVAQNTQLSKALIAKEKVIKDLQEHRAWSDANSSTLMTKLESAEKENASLKYELRVVERELDIRNEEKEFSRRTAEVTHKKHLESAKKIAKLESECQRLRLLVRKRLPGPAALAKMRFEVDMLSKDPAETRCRKSTSSTFSMDLAVNAPDTPTKRINFLAKQLSEVKEENKTLKEALIVQANNPQLSKNIFNSSTSKFLEVEAQLDESSEGLTVMGLARNVPAMHEFSLASMPDMDSDGKLSCVESVTSGFISKMEPLGDCKRGSPSSVAVGDSGLSLMDDFVEMEKLAVGSTGKSFRSSDPDGGSIFGGPFEVLSSGCFSEATGIEIVPVDHLCDPSVLKKVIQTGKTSDHSPVWVDDIVKVVLEQSRANQKSPDAILEVIKVAVTHDSPSEPYDFVDKSLSHCDGRGCSSLELPNKSSCNMHSPDRLFVDNMLLTDKNNQQFQLDLNESVRKIIKLVEGSSFASSHHNTPDILNAVADCSKSSKVSETSTGYMVRVFQWKESDLSAVLQKFVQICNEILNGNTDVKNFVEELTSSLEWIINHCFSLQDVSSMRDAIKEHFDWDGSQSENDMEDEMINHFPGAHNLHAPLVSNWKCHNNILHMEDELSNTKCGESIERFQSNVSAKESLRIQSPKSEKTIASLQVELEVLSQSKIYIEDQFQNLKSLAEDLDTQLTAARIEISECSEKLSLLEDELDNKNMVCEELEASCLDLQLQIESMKQNETLRYDQNSEERQLQNDLEIISASEKLAECQETIFNLGRQLQAMGSPTAASKVTVASNSMTTMGCKKKSSQRTSLLDKLLAEDSAGRRYPGSPTTKVLCTSSSPTVVDSTSGSTYGLEHKRNSSEMSLKTNDIRHQDVKAAGNSFAIIRSKDISDRGLWKNMLWRLKKSHSKKGPSHMLHNTTT